MRTTVNERCDVYAMYDLWLSRLSSAYAKRNTPNGYGVRTDDRRKWARKCVREVKAWLRKWRNLD